MSEHTYNSIAWHRQMEKGGSIWVMPSHSLHLIPSIQYFATVYVRRSSAVVSRRQALISLFYIIRHLFYGVHFAFPSMYIVAISSTLPYLRSSSAVVLRRQARRAGSLLPPLALDANTRLSWSNTRTPWGDAFLCTRKDRGQEKGANRF